MGVQILEEKLQEDEEGIIRLMQEQQLRLQAMQQQQDEDALAAALAQSLSSNNNAPPNQLPNQTEIDTLRAEFEQQIEERRQALTEQRALRERLRSQIDALRLRQQQNAANDDEEEDNDANSIRRLFGMMSAPRGGYSGRGRGSHYAQMYDAHSLSSFGSNAQSIANLWREQPAQRLHRDRRNPYDRHHGYGRGRGRGGMFRGNWDDLQAQRHRHRRRRGAANQNAEEKKNDNDDEEEKKDENEDGFKSEKLLNFLLNKCTQDVRECVQRSKHIHKQNEIVNEQNKKLQDAENKEKEKEKLIVPIMSPSPICRLLKVIQRDLTMR